MIKPHWLFVLNNSNRIQVSKFWSKFLCKSPDEWYVAIHLPHNKRRRWYGQWQSSSISERNMKGLVDLFICHVCFILTCLRNPAKVEASNSTVSPSGWKAFRKELWRPLNSNSLVGTNKGWLPHGSIQWNFTRNSSSKSKELGKFPSTELYKQWRNEREEEKVLMHNDVHTTWGKIIIVNRSMLRTKVTPRGANIERSSFYFVNGKIALKCEKFVNGKIA